VPKGIQAIRTEEEKCTRRFVIGADALFEFDRATLTLDAEETLTALAPLLLKAGPHRRRSKGTPTPKAPTPTTRP